MLALAACSSTPEPTITVRICGDLVVPDDVDAVRLTILDPDRNQLWTSLDELATPELDAARFDFALGEAGLRPPTLGDGSVDGGDVGILDASPVVDAGVGDATVSDGGVDDLDAGPQGPPSGPQVSLVEQVPAFRGDIWLQVQALKDGIGQVTAEVRPGAVARIALSRACVGVTCMAGLTCLNGQCVQVPPAMECPTDDQGGAELEPDANSVPETMPDIGAAEASP